MTMGLYLLLSIGLIATSVQSTDGGAEEEGAGCPGLRPTKRLVCYLEVKGAVVPPLDPCYCTHLVLTTPLAKLSSDSEAVSTLAVTRRRNPDLQVLGLASDPAETVLKRRDAYVKALVSVLRKTGLDGIELDLTWSQRFSGKDMFYELVKLLFKEMKRLYEQSPISNESYNRRSKRDGEQHYTTTKHSSNQERTTIDDDDLDTTDSEERNRKTTRTTKRAENKVETTTPRTASTEKEIDNTEEDEDDISDELNGYVISVRLPSEPQYLAKNFDLKRLSKYVNFFTIASENVTDASGTGMTYHPSRLMGIEDILNSDSLVDLITGLGAPHSKLVLSLPGFALRFTLKDPEKNMPLSPVKTKPRRISQAEVCALMSEGKWTLERDEDLTAPYAYSNDTWLAFDDRISAAIKGKYILLRDLGGAAIVTLDYADWSGKCVKKLQQHNDNGKTNNNGTIASAMAVLPALFETFTSMARKSRAAQLISLQEQLHQYSPYSFSADVQLSPYRIVRVVDRAGSTHVVRKEAKTEFECSRQGYFRHPSGCNRFYRCVKFNQYTPDFTVFEYDCPAGLAFDEKYEVCVWPGSLEDGGACQGSSEIAPVPKERFSCPHVEGYYADPENCRWFFACLDHARDGATPLTAYEFRCPFGLVFNEQSLVCDWPWNVAGCGGAGAYRAKFTVGDLLEGRARPSYATLPDYHVSGGRIENAGGGVVLGSSILPGIVEGGAYQGAYSSESDLKYPLGVGGYYNRFGAGSGYYGQGSSGAHLLSGSAGQYSAGAGIHSLSGGYSGENGGHYAGLGGVYGGGSGYYGGANNGYYAGSGKYAEAGGKYAGASGLYSGAAGGYSGESGESSGASGKFAGAGGATFAAGGDHFSSGGSGVHSAQGSHYGGEHVNVFSGGEYSGLAKDTVGVHFGAGEAVKSGSFGSGYSAGASAGSYVDGHAFQHENGAGIKTGSFYSGYDSAAHGASGIFEAGKAYSGRIPSSTPRPLVTPIVTHDGSSASGFHYQENEAFAHHDAGAGYVSTLAPAVVGQQHIAVTPVTVTAPVLPVKPIQYFGSHASSSGVLHETPISFVTPTPSPAPISHVSHAFVPVSQTGHGVIHEDHEQYLSVTALPPLKPVSFVSGIQYRKPVVPVTSTAIPSFVSVSTPAPPVQFNYYSTPQPALPVIHKQEYHEGYEYSKPAFAYSTPSPPPAIFSVSTPAPPVVPVKASYPRPQPFASVVYKQEYEGYDYPKPIPVSTPAPAFISVSTPAPPVSPVKLAYYPRPQPATYDLPKPVVPVISTPAPQPAYFTVSTPAPPVKFNYPKPILPEIYKEEYEGYQYSRPVSTPAPPPAYFSLSSPAPPVKLAYYPRPQPVIPINHKPEIESYIYSKPVTPVVSVSTPAPFISVSTPAPTPSPVKLAYYPRPQPVIPINHKPEVESYVYSRPTIAVSSTPAPSVSPLVSTPVSFHQGYSGEEHGYHYIKPAIEFSYPKPQSQVFKSIVNVPSVAVTPSPPPVIVSSTPAYSPIKFGYEHKPIEFKSSTIAAHPIISSTPIPPPSAYHYPVLTPTPIPVEHKNVEVGFTYAKDGGYHYQRPVVAYPPPPPPPAYVQHHFDAKHEQEIHHHQPVVDYKFVSSTPAPLPTVTYRKPLVPVAPVAPQPIVHQYEEQNVHGYNQFGYDYQQPHHSVLPPLDVGYGYQAPVVKAPLPPKAYYNVAPASSVKFGAAYEKPLAPVIPVVSSTPAPPPTPFVHYSTTVSPPPQIKPINVVDYSYSYPKPVPSVLPPIRVTPLPPLNPIQYRYSKPIVPVVSHVATAGYSEYVSSTPSPIQSVSYGTLPPPTVAPVHHLPPPTPIVSKAPVFPTAFIASPTPPPVSYLPPPSPPQSYLPPPSPASYLPPPSPASYLPPPVVKYSTPAPFKPAGFAHLGPKYHFVDGYASSTPLPVHPAPISSIKFGYAYEKPTFNAYPTPAPIEISSTAFTPVHPTTPSPPPFYIKTQTVVPAPAPTPIVPMYQKVINAFKAPVVSAYEKVLNVLKTSSPATPSVYVNHYSSTPAPPVTVTTYNPPVSVVSPHEFEYSEIQGGYKHEGGNLYESLKNEFGSKLSTYEGGYDYPKPAIKFEEQYHGDQYYNVKHAGQQIKYSTAAFTPTVGYKQVYTPSTTVAPPAYAEYDYGEGKYEHENEEVYYSSTPSTTAYKPTIKQFLQQVVYSKPTVSAADYGHAEDLHYIGTPITTTFLPPVTTARVSLPVIKTPVSGCINCGYSKSQNVRVRPPVLPVTYSTTTPVPYTVSTPYTISSPAIYSKIPSTTTAQELHYEEHSSEEEGLDIANEEIEGAQILEGYNDAGQYGGVLSQSVGVKGVTSPAPGVVGLSSTTISSLKDGETIVGVIKKEKNVYTGRQDKAKVVVVSRLSDFNPILVGKLGAECSCKSDPVALRRRGKAKYNQQTKTYELFVPSDEASQDISYGPSYTSTLSTPLAPIIVPDTLSNGEYGYSSNNHEESLSSVVEIKPFVHQSLRTTVLPVTKYIPSSLHDAGYSTTEAYIGEPVSSTVSYEEPHRVIPLVKTKKIVSAARHRPVYADRSVLPTYQEVLVPTIPAQTIADLDHDAKISAGKSFDRYGPGGWRSADETLQGSVDCKRAGLFRHPKYCNKFYACNWDSWKKRFTLHVFNCPVHLAYDQQLGACNWPSKGPACSDDNLLV